MDTIFALSSGRPPAAISVIRVSGPSAHRAVLEMAGSLPEARVAAVRELRDPNSGEVLDTALLLRFDGAASSTGEDCIELHCHGGRAVVDCVLGVLAARPGMRVAEPGEFTRRAFENGRIDLTEAEGLADLIEAETQSQRKSALALAHGGLRKEINSWREWLLRLSAQAEAAIDYDEEDSPPDEAIAGGCKILAAELLDWLARPRVEALKDGIRVVIAGPPNSGKSSLLNALVGSERAIVAEVAGTTRDHIDVPISISGTPVVLTDTAGLRDTHDAVEAIGVGRAAALVDAADIVIWLGAPDEAPAHPSLIQVHSKCDLPQRFVVPANAIAVSSSTGAGLADLLEEIKARSSSFLPSEGAIALNRRQAALIGEAATALGGAASARDVVLVAEQLRLARSAFDRLTGRTAIEDVLDTLFSRFCLGK